jgi:Tol biopolymer transport system component
LPGQSADLWRLPLDGGAPVKFVANGFDADISPDGRWVAYQALQGDRSEVVVRPFPAGDRQWLVSRKEGGSPLWAKDGKRLFYLESSGSASTSLMEVEVAAGDTFAPGIAKVVFQVPQMISFAGVSADAQRFLTVSTVEGDVGERPGPRALTFLSDWRARLPH